mmetsp:Transcript_32593/g.64636  ORF Transcript_32593/g.64636 Transcript_32593/m.64636 type:complete len:80 (+) Transcript_32593:403-642(+)
MQRSQASEEWTLCLEIDCTASPSVFKKLNDCVSMTVCFFFVREGCLRTCADFHVDRCENKKTNKYPSPKERKQTTTETG